MPLAPGTGLGTYQVLAPLGAGGMGEVYRARDTQLKRDVALKVLPAVFASQPDRLARFQSEAELLASLNHPNIAAIYGLEHADGVHALAMEFVEGASPKGPVPFDEAWKICSQIADALEYAHEKGVIHRDLKPANVMVTPDGVVKLLDFGLAKAMSSRVSSGQPATGEDSPTLTMALTEAGMILGTAAYMSPEQAKGKSADKRADIWAFGVVLWELLTGQRLFKGEDAADTLAQVLTKQPDFERVPSEVRTLLRDCLQKDPKLRLRDIGDAKRLVRSKEVSGAEVSRSTPTQWKFAKLGWVTAVVFAITTGTVSFIHFGAAPQEPPTLRLSVPFPASSNVGYVSLSPDGKNLAIALIDNGKTRLLVRSMQEGDVKTLVPIVPITPFWSPDSKNIGFFDGSESKLKVAKLSGGPTETLCDNTGRGGGGTWNTVGVILFAKSEAGPIYKTSVQGGGCVALTRPKPGIRHRFPSFLPDGSHFIYLSDQGPESESGIYAASIDNPTGRLVSRETSGAFFAPSSKKSNAGYLIFLRGSQLFAQPFSAERLETTGDPLIIASDASVGFTTPLAAASASENGLIAYLANGDPSRQLTWFDRSGKELGHVGPAQPLRNVSISPNGLRAATVVRTPQGFSAGILLYDFSNGEETHFTSPSVGGTTPVWSPDSTRIAFSFNNDLYYKGVTTGEEQELIVKNSNAKTPSDWSRDGRFLIYSEIDPRTASDIWYIENPADKSERKKPVKFLATSSIESQGQLSPDNHWIAYTSIDSGDTFGEVYVKSFPKGPERWKISSRGGWEPRWGRNGDELFYDELFGAEHHLMSVPVQRAETGIKFGTPKLLFVIHSQATVPQQNTFLYSVHPDGKRLLVNQFANADLIPTVNVVTNWEKALERK